MTLSEKLALLRREKGLSQMAVAEALHGSRQAVSRWEVGTAVPSTDNLKYLSRLYGVPVDLLLDDRQELPAGRETPPAPEPDPPTAPAELEHPRAAVPRRLAAAVIGATLVLGLGVGILVGVWILPKESPPEILPLDSTQHEDISSEAKDVFSFDENLDTLE